MSVRPLLPLAPFAGLTADGEERRFGVRFVFYSNAEVWEAIFADIFPRCACCGSSIKNVVVVDEDIERPMHGPGLDTYGLDCFARLFGKAHAKAAREARNEWRRVDTVSRRSRDGWIASLDDPLSLGTLLTNAVENLRRRMDIVETRLRRADTDTRAAIRRDPRLHDRHEAEVIAALDERIARVRARLA